MSSSATDEKELFEFLDSLPTDTEKDAAKSATTTAAATSSTSTSTAAANSQASNDAQNLGKKDEDILNFLDELEGKNKGVKSSVESSNDTIKSESNTNTIPIKTVEPPMEPTKEGSDSNNVVNDPITSIASWWSSTGSNQLSSLWGTAQKQAEGAIKKARENTIEDNLRTAFKELGISNVRDNIDSMLTDEQKAELSKLSIPDAKKTLESLNSGLNLGLSFMEGTLNDVVDKINSLNNKDEVIEIVVVHDMKNFIGLPNMIKLNFEDVMNQQVDGSIDVIVHESGTARRTSVIDPNEENDKNTSLLSEERINFALFNGKGSDAEKLIMANIENEIKRRTSKEDITNESSTSDSSATDSTTEGEPVSESKPIPPSELTTRKTVIYISLLAWTSNKDNSVSDSKEVIIDSHSPASFTISCVLKDEIHGISINSQSQPLPLKWAKWIEGDFDENEKEEDIDPAEWVIGWIRNTVSNVIGVTSQTYIIKRMGY